MYWAKRLKQHPLVNNEKVKLIQMQKGQCPRCGLYFRDGDLLEVDHSISLALGGMDERSYKWAYYRHRHDEKTVEDLAQ
jgi:RNA-directed DNA polymerase